jgi:hypothetical protein
MDLIVDLIDQLIEERIRVALADSNWNGKDENKIVVLKEKIRRVLVENIPNK